MLALSPPVEARQAVPIGPEFQVNTSTLGRQRVPNVAVEADGDFVVVWAHERATHPGSDYDYDILGQRYDSRGVARGGEFQVNTYTPGTQWMYRPSIASDAGGGFVVVWQSDGSNGSDSSDSSVQARRFASDGTPLGAEFQVNTYTPDLQRRAAVSMDAGGGFVVVWESGKRFQDSTIRAQRYASDGTPLGAELMVNSAEPAYLRNPSVAMDADGDFVVVWAAYGYWIQGQRYASDGTARDSHFQIDGYTRIWKPKVSMDADGDFVVVWQSGGLLWQGADGSNAGVQGQRFASDGTALGEDFQVNTQTLGPQYFPVVSSDPDGDFVVVWFSCCSSAASYFDVLGQRYGSNGSPLGGEFAVNSYTTDGQLLPSVSLATDGDFVVTWESLGSAGSDSSEESIQARRFSASAFEVFIAAALDPRPPDAEGSRD